MSEPILSQSKIKISQNKNKQTKNRSLMSAILGIESSLHSDYAELRQNEMDRIWAKKQTVENTQ